MVDDQAKPKKPSIKWKDGKKPSKQRFILKPRNQRPEFEFPFTDDDFNVLSDLVSNLTGISLDDQKKEMVYARLVKRLRKLDLKNFRDYLVFLNTDQGPREIIKIANAITTNLTKFYREPHHFDHLTEECFRPMASQLKEGETKRIRVWSAGCSSGEEAYTIAYIINHFLKSHNLQNIDAKVLATDIDTDMLAHARKGLYDETLTKGLPDQFQKMFYPDQETGSINLKINPILREMIAFKFFNFIDDEWPMSGPFDAIFCRNVMIYFDDHLKRKMVTKFANLLRPGGFLYIGHSENIKGSHEGLERVAQTTYMKL